MTTERDWAIFDRVYENNLWRSDESVSGPGSTLASSAALRTSLPILFARLGIRTLVDGPAR